MPKQVKGVGIIPPPRGSQSGGRQCGGAANFCRSAACCLYLSLAYHTRETRVGWFNFLLFEIKSDRIIALNFGGGYDQDKRNEDNRKRGSGV